MSVKMQKSLKLNMALNAVKGMLGVIFPLISFPYVSRILGEERLGQYSFAASVVSYFILFAGLGIGTYAIREGAALRDNPACLEKLASELFSINILSTAISYVLLLVCVLMSPKLQTYHVLIAIFSVEIFFKAIGLEWIYSVFEDYVFITIRSIIFYIISLILLFLLVRTEKDVGLYAAVTVFSNAGANIVNCIFARRYCTVRFTWRISWKRHMRPILILFAMSATVSIYVSSDTTLLGFLCDDATVGIYSVSTKIYSIVKTILASVYVVSIPRLAALWGKGDRKNFCITAEDIYGTLLSILLPAMTGIILLRRQIVVLVAGERFAESASSLMLLAVALLCCFGAYFWGQCILVPVKRESTVFRITLISALVNIILNFLLIPIWKENAAAFTTIVAEGIAYVLSRRVGLVYLRMDRLPRLVGKVLVGCLGIILIAVILQYVINSILIYTVSTVFWSVMVYGVIEILLKNEKVTGLLWDIIRRLKLRRSM